MTKRSIFAKIFLITFALFSGLVILLHASVYFIFPSTYIESQHQTILKKSQALAKSFQDQEEGTIESVIDLYSINESGIIDIKNGRHPVVEKMITNDMFIENDTYLDKYIAPVAKWMNNNLFFSSLAEAFMRITPITLGGAFVLLDRKSVV